MSATKKSKAVRGIYTANTTNSVFGVKKGDKIEVILTKFHNGETFFLGVMNSEEVEIPSVFFNAAPDLNIRPTPIAGKYEVTEYFLFNEEIESRTCFVFDSTSSDAYNDTFQNFVKNSYDDLKVVAGEWEIEGKKYFYPMHILNENE